MARVLVVDDEPGLRSFLTATLERDGHEVTPASDGAEAFSRLATDEFDVVLTDLKMPGVGGLEVLAQVRAEHPLAQVIVLTAHGTVGTAVEAMKLGAFDYLQKPVGSPEELRLVVRRALERKSLLTFRESVTRQRAGSGRSTFRPGAKAMAAVHDALGKVARTDATVLLLGESGVGKEVAARALHEASARAEAPFVALNCATLSETLLESELFGHEKGAFTGATAQRQGRLEYAEGGTFFLDEVGELRLPLQARLLRVLQERTFERVGGNRTIKANVRWIAATNCDLEAMVRDGTFRDDLFHRLAVFPIRIPPLRERAEDIVPLARVLLEELCGELARPVLTLSAAAERALLAAPWPGNIRQLRNALERAAILVEGPVIDVAQLDTPPGERTPEERLSMAGVEREAIVRALAASQGNRRKAAEALGIGLRTLYEKLKKYDLG